MYDVWCVMVEFALYERRRSALVTWIGMNDGEDRLREGIVPDNGDLSSSILPKEMRRIEVGDAGGASQSVKITRIIS